MLFVTDEPENHKLISMQEVEYILAQRKIPSRSFGKKRPPYLKILLNRTVWTLAFCDFASTFGLYMVVIEGPSFISNVLNKNILEVDTKCLFSYVMVVTSFTSTIKAFSHQVHLHIITEWSIKRSATIGNIYLRIDIFFIVGHSYGQKLCNENKITVLHDND